MADLFGPILEVIKFIGRPATKYLNYHRKFEDYVDDFKQAQEDLQVRKGDIQQQLQDEHRFGKKPKQELENWFKKVEEKLGHAHCLDDKVSKGKYLFRSCLGKLVDEETQAMKKVYAEGHFSGSLVVNDPSTVAVKLPTPELAGESNVAGEIYKYLIGDEVRMIGVCGMGGIGKTTIMKHVYNRLLEETKFGKLIWTTVSQDFDIRRLQKSIASKLKEDLSDGEDIIMRAAQLSVMLEKQGRYVLILDDVWGSFSLEDVGILEPTADNGCKLVLTTRSEEVVRSMGCRKVQVACLSTDEALQLFLSKVGQDMLSSPTLEPIMKDIVGECDGLPLAIVTVAGCMRGISNPLVWDNALNELRGYIRNIRDVEDKVFGCLRFSYDRLRQIDQDCFLYCALYPEDKEIKKEEIIEYWIEEGLIDEMGTRKAMQGSGHSILQKLEENCLLERVGEQSTHIKMHDVVRDMALHITRKRFFVKAGKLLKRIPNEEEWSEHLEKVSLMGNCISTIPQNMKFPKFQKLTTLLLSGNSLEEIPDCFFEHTPILKILDLSDNPIENLPNSISNLEKLTALLLNGCQSINNLPSLSKLQALKKLDLGNTLLKEIPQGLELLENLRYLNLGLTWCLEEVPSGLWSNLRHLQYLEIHPAPTRAEEMMELSELEVFEGCFSTVRDLNLYTTQRKKLHKYLIWVTHVLNDYYLILDRDQLMNYDKTVAFLGVDRDGIMLPDDIQQLSVLSCEGMRSLNDICGLKDATNLKEFQIQGCDELESILLSKGQLETLESLKLFYLENLKAIVGDSSVDTFSSLREVRLYGCGKIKNLFSAKWVLHNLEEIDVMDCDKMEEIIASEEEGMGTNNNTNKYTLPKLRIFKLWNLPELKGIVGESSVGTFSSLKEIHLTSCKKIKKLFSAKWILHNLEEIDVGYCDEMEDIIASEEEGMGTNNNNTIKYTLPKLRALELCYLPELKSICSKNGAMVCDSLQHIHIKYCPKLKRIPLYLPQLDLDKGKLSPPPPLKEIRVHPNEWWESVEWDLPDAKNILLPFLK